MALTVGTALPTLIAWCGRRGILYPLRGSVKQVIKLNTELHQVRPEFREGSIIVRI